MKAGVDDVVDVNGDKEARGEKTRVQFLYMKGFRRLEMGGTV